MKTQSSASVLTPDERIAATRALNSMPYGGGAGFQFPIGGQTGSSVAYNLAILRDILKGVAQQNAILEERYSILKRDVEGIRRVFGAKIEGE